MAGTSTPSKISDGTVRYRPRFRDAGGRQHERRFRPKVNAQRWLDEQTSHLSRGPGRRPSAGGGRWRTGRDRGSTLRRRSSRARATVIGHCWGSTCSRYGVVTALRTSLMRTLPSGRPHWSAKGWDPPPFGRRTGFFGFVLTLEVQDGRIPRNPAEGVPLPRSHAASLASSPEEKWRASPLLPASMPTSSSYWPGLHRAPVGRTGGATGAPGGP